ncbi:RiPP maturation radical SAM C-methyltransferase [Sphingomonas sp. LB-2]|uniref:RiPP maturation radical SAM C-methyltransferase n=1 Tax=Sphingomonas caeni TaxID=2984949 RepID=UPI002232ACBB|nr:RiPP maturation radical SAM C-methyltransferase [Sphingomonas caeni]MCW3848265.1 RiPP maturation radical SAM C-methyltransferase [Sphingomonas caeni]
MRLDICLVVPPFAQVETPSLGPAILAAACRERGFATRVLHANLMLAARVGHPHYRAVANSNFASMLGERLFVPHAYPPGTVLDEPNPLSAAIRAEHDAIAPVIAPFLDAVCAQIVALNPRILGISSVYQQTLAASAIALRVKRAAPGIRIVLGGANAASPMGEALAGILPWIDHFFSGEADIAFPDFCADLLRDGAPDAPRVIHCPPLADLRHSPAPDFDDYFADLRAAQAEERLPAALPDALPVETSRGCWWGAKNHCTFCGLNGATMAFREKPAPRALEEFDALEARWGVGRYAVADNIMPLRYLDALLPVLAARERPPALFYEVKANLTAAQLALMARAGIGAIQPGIESLSTPVLKLMRKGVSAHQNLMLLRDCRSLGITVVWNYLYGFPGERLEHYDAVVPWISAIEHLQPPEGFSPLLIDRYSPYFNTPGAFGIAAVEPIRDYRGLYPRDAPLDAIAYHFRGDYATPLFDDAEARRPIARAIGEWRLQWIVGAPPELRIAATDTGTAVLVDTRRIARERYLELPADWALALRLLERPRTRDAIDTVTATVLEELLARGYVIEHEGKLLSVVTRELADSDRDDLARGEGAAVSAAPEMRPVASRTADSKPALSATPDIFDIT